MKKTLVFATFVLVAVALAGCPSLPDPDDFANNPYVDRPTIEVSWPNEDGITEFALTIPYGKEFSDFLSQDSIYVDSSGGETVTTRSITDDSQIDQIGVSSDEFGWDVSSVLDWQKFCYDNHRITVWGKIGSAGHFRGNIFVARTTDRGLIEISYLNLASWQGWFGQNTQIIRSDGLGGNGLVIEFWLTDTSGNGNGSEGEGEGNTDTAPQVLDQPDTLSATVGQRVEFKVVASGGNLSYQWRCNGVAIPSNDAGENVSGGTVNSTGIKSDTLVILSVGEINEASYDVVITNSKGSVTSNVANLTVNPVTDQNAPQVTADPADQSVIVGNTFSLAVTATGSGTLAYQWYKDNVAITGANSASYSKSAVLADAGLYKVKVSNAYGEAWSYEAVVTVRESTTALKGGEFTYNSASQTLSATIEPANIQFLGLNGKTPTAYGYMRFYDNYPSGPYFVQEVSATNGTNVLTIGNMECRRTDNDGNIILRTTPIAIAAPDETHPDGVYFGNIDPTIVWFGFNDGVMPIVRNAFQKQLN